MDLAPFPMMLTKILAIGLLLGGMVVHSACGQRKHTQDTGFGSARGPEKPRAPAPASTFETEADRAKRDMLGGRAGMTPRSNAPAPTPEAR
jgi:hypothetical protein